MKNNQRGITLIALVVTIILLIVLATVSMSMILGNNGLIARATESREWSARAFVKETLDTGIGDAEAVHAMAHGTLTKEEAYRTTFQKISEVTIETCENGKLIGKIRNQNAKDEYGFEIDVNQGGILKITDKDGYELEFEGKISNGLGPKAYAVTIGKGFGIAEVQGEGLYKPGDTVTVSCTPEEGYFFDNWTGDMTEATFTMPESNVAMRANGYKITYTLDCGKEEHSHTSECEQSHSSISYQLGCNKIAHTHTSSCVQSHSYVSSYYTNCGYTAHTHSSSCYGEKVCGASTTVTNCEFLYDVYNLYCPTHGYIKQAYIRTKGGSVGTYKCTKTGCNQTLTATYQFDSYQSDITCANGHSFWSAGSQRAVGSSSYGPCPHKESNVLTCTKTEHTHTGSSSSGGGCYGGRNYSSYTDYGNCSVGYEHTHTGSSETGGGCYTNKVNNSYTDYGNCPFGYEHHHEGSPETGGGCYTKENKVTA